MLNIFFWIFKDKQLGIMPFYDNNAKLRANKYVYIYVYTNKVKFYI